MDIRYACEILGVSADTDFQEIRRAYLRLVRQHKPDQDPEGFRLIREAFEVLQEKEQAGAPPGPPARFRWPLEADGRSEPRGPADPEVPEGEEPPEASEVRPGVPLDLAPNPLSTAYEVLRQSGDDGDAVAKVPDLVKEGLEVVATRDAGGLAGLALDLFFDLQARGHLEISHRVLEEIENHPEAYDRDDHEFIVDLILADELRKLSRAFPQHIRAEIARCIRAGRIFHAKEAMHEFAMESPRRANAAAEKLKATPALFQIYHHILSGPESETYYKPAVAVPVTGLLLFLFFILRGGCDTGSRVPELPPDAVREFEFSSEILRARGVAKANCGSNYGEPKEEICGLLFAYLDALDEGRCEEALDLRRKIIDLNEAEPRFTPAASRFLWGVANPRCGELTGAAKVLTP